MDTSRNSYGRELPRAAEILLDEWMRGLPFGRLPPETVPTRSGDGSSVTNIAVEVDGEPLTVRAFLNACRQAEPEKVDAILHALDRRKAIDPTRPYAAPDLATPLVGPALLTMLAKRLKDGGPVPVRVAALGSRSVKGEPLRTTLLAMRNDRSRDAVTARDILGLDDMPDGQVATIVLDKLERAGVLELARHGDDRAAVRGRVMELERARSGAAGR